MLILALPLLAFGAVATAVGRSMSASQARAERGGGGSDADREMDSPEDAASALTVMGSFLRANEPPPPAVVNAAIAEAHALGRVDLVDDIVRAFVLPAEVAAERAAADPHYPIPPGSDVESSLGQASMYDPYPAAVAMAAPSHDPVAAAAEAERVLAELEAARTCAAKVEMLPDAGVATPAGTPPPPPPQTITVSGKSSPIEGVETDDWSAFVSRVSRELPTFTTPSHVGQFRQRRDRLSELGIDPNALVGCADAQAAAFDADMGDAYRHAQASGMLEEHVGTHVQVPVDGGVRAESVTLSGVLGVVQAAGLEGAAQWFEQPADRERFPRTTLAFLRTNGVF